MRKITERGNQLSNPHPCQYGTEVINHSRLNLNETMTVKGATDVSYLLLVSVALISQCISQMSPFRRQ